MVSTGHCMPCITLSIAILRSVSNYTGGRDDDVVPGIFPRWVH